MMCGSASPDCWSNIVGEKERSSPLHDLAEFIAARLHAESIIEIAYGSPVNCGLAAFRKQCPQKWIEIKLDGTGGKPHIDEKTVRDSIIVCANVIERVTDSSALLSMLGQLCQQAHAVIIATADRQHASGGKWNLAEFGKFLSEMSIVPAFIGLTGQSNEDLQKAMIVTVLDWRCSLSAARPIPTSFRPLAILATYNDADIVPSIVTKLLDDRIDVHVLDNWSTDGTFEAMQTICAARDSLTLERFPPIGPTQYYEWRDILRRKEEIAARLPGRWIIHCDSDEILCSPWLNVSLRGALFMAEDLGFSAADFTVCHFLPVDGSFAGGADPEKHFRYFEFGNHLALSVQVRAWQQGTERVALADSGGHEARFLERKIFPYKFIIKHYSIRSPQQGRRKVFIERLGRFHPEERKIGWHTHYDDWKPDHPFIWNASHLIEFDEQRTRQLYLTEFIAGIGIFDSLRQGHSRAGSRT
jgi:hypothetical protein